MREKLRRFRIVFSLIIALCLIVDQVPAKDAVSASPLSEAVKWPGPDEVIESDLVFSKNASGLDFFNNKLYVVDNGNGKIWITDVKKDGTISFAKGFENGKYVNFKTPSAKGPDAEGITVDEEGHVYISSERDSTVKDVNYNVILKVDPYASGKSVNATKQWDITNILPDAPANKGIEAVEWVSNSEVAGNLFDMNTNAPYDPSIYPNAIANGIFFVALENNGHVYAFVLNEDETAVKIADIDSKIGGAMALEYDTYEKQLWVAADDGYGNIAAQIEFNGTSKPNVTLVAPAKGVDITRNNEGFAIAPPEYTVDGKRPVYRLADGVLEGALTIGYIDCDYVEEVIPTVAPSVMPSEAPTVSPGVMPSEAPTVSPSVVPSEAPTVSPSVVPSEAPTVSPSVVPSEVPTAGPSGVNKPAKVIIISAKNNKNKTITVKIKKTKNAKKYRVQYATNKKFKKAKTVITKKLTIALKKLKKKLYYIRVRGANGKVVGPWSRVKKVKL